MEVLTRCERNCLEFFLKGELDHHGAQRHQDRMQQGLHEAQRMAQMRL